MSKYKVVYSHIYEKFVVKRYTCLGWVSLEEFEKKEDAIAFAKRLSGKRA